MPSACTAWSSGTGQPTYCAASTCECARVRCSPCSARTGPGRPPPWRSSPERAAWDLVRRFAARAKTIVLTTHYLDEAEALAERAAVIAAGRVLTSGPLAELGGSLGSGSEGTAGAPTSRATVSFGRPVALACA